MASTLETIVFESATEADLWWKVVNTRNAEAKYTTSTLKKLGLEDAFDEFSISPLRFQENLTGQKERLLCSNVSLPFEEWLKSVADAVNMDPEGVSTLFLNVVAEEFSSLPILCKNVIDLFCNAGDLIVTSRGSEEQQVYPMTEFFTTYPTKIFSLLEKERTGKVFLNFTLDLNGLCNYLNSYFQNSGNSPDSWFRERESAMRLLSLKLKKNLVTSIKSTLVENANFHLSVDGMRFLDTICSLGPYERTFLNIEPFSDTEHSWNPEWNVVEALPSSEPALGFQRHKRICGAFREQNGVTAFCVVDEYGNLCDHTLWADCSLEKDTGRYRKQQEALKRIIVDHSPSMIVVGASGVHSLVLMRMMSDFIKDASFDFEISVVWGATRVASCYSTTQQALRQLGNYDSIIRTAIGLARFAQDPLLTLCALFDEERSVLQILPLDQYSDRFQSRLYSSLCWNMTLWVAAVGCGVDQCIKRPDSVLFIQFIPGLGASTGRVFFDQLVRQTNVTKDSLKLLLADSFDESVCSNALDFFRFPLSLEEPHTNLNAYLDQTLIPDVWRDAAYFILDQLEQNIPNFVKAEMGLFAVSERREMIYESMDAQYLLSLVKSSMLSCRNVIGLREVEFILDEFIALGASMMRRPYRRMSSHEVMLNVTGILYSDRPRTQHGVLPTDSRSLLVCRRDYVFGSVHAVRMGSEPGVMFLSSFGIRAFVSVNSFPDSMKDELFQCIEEASTDPRAERPVWMRRGCPIQGIVTNCLWSRCELAVTWCPQREGQRITTIRRPLFAASHDAESSVNSVKTVALQRSALKYSRKISSHPLFRDVSPNEISEMLRERKIGEVLFCISTRNEKPVCAIKISHLQSSNWEVEEKGNPMAPFTLKCTTASRGLPCPTMMPTS
ncbi:hypothetical protein AGDE_11478 [Angomonas deanei]|nr:hypothetical protein AGDE_11478 [Angomonas deanei]|eukprot:EPY26224.1 hypothetical protein AGDE_11478 [Angomonas deanei]